MIPLPNMTLQMSETLQSTANAKLSGAFNGWGAGTWEVNMDGQPDFSANYNAMRASPTAAPAIPWTLIAAAAAVVFYLKR